MTVCQLERAKPLVAVLRRMSAEITAMKPSLRRGSILTMRSTRTIGAGRDASLTRSALILRLPTALLREPCA